jgi:ribonuclease P protein component
MVLRLLPADVSLLPPACRRLPPSSWRCSVVVSSKVHKRAVRRNRLRRILHQELRRIPPQPMQPLWLLLSLRPGSAEIEEERLLGEWDALLRQAGLRP